MEAALVPPHTRGWTEDALEGKIPTPFVHRIEIALKMAVVFPDPRWATL
jgi:hypothetical protein